MCNPLRDLKIHCPALPKRSFTSFLSTNYQLFHCSCDYRLWTFGASKTSRNRMVFRYHFQEYCDITLSWYCGSLIRNQIVGGAALKTSKTHLLRKRLQPMINRI